MLFKAGFIGCGNMGGALARAAARAVGGVNIAVYDMDDSKTALLCTECSTLSVEPEELIANSEFIFLGIKPQFMFEAINPLVEKINSSKCVVVTMAAGLEITYYEEVLGIKRPIIRIMPNTPCSVGYGVILYAFNDLVTISAVESFKMLMSEAGLLDRLTEKLIDAGSAVSGCGPAFAFIFAEALADAGVECGLPRDKALKYAAQMLKGSAELLLQNGNPGVLKDNVCSPGGTTIAGVHALEDAGFRAAAMNAVVAAYKRTLELN
jgi:pyrroline-5-carboxylate reductase